MTRRVVVAASVLVAWAAGLGLLLARELNPSPEARLAEVALRIVPTTQFYMVEQSGRHIGFASIAIDTVPHALQVTEYVVTDSVGGARTTDQLVVRLSRGLTLRDYESTGVLGTDSTRRRGQVVDSTLVVHRDGGADTLSVAAPVFAGIIGAAVTVLLDDPRIGATRSMRMIDPTTGRAAMREIRMAAESLFVVVDSAVADSSGRWFAVHKDTVRAWRLQAEGTPPLDAWIDAQGLVVEARLANGQRLRRTAFEIAFENWRLANPVRAVSARGDGSVIAGTWLASGAARPSVAIDTMLVRVGASVPREFAMRFGRGYRAGNQMTYARILAARLQARYALPMTEAWRRGFVNDLAPGPFIESDHPAIAQRASRLAANGTDPTAVAGRIVAWLHDSVRASPAATPLTAAGALDGRAGDAREFALLTTAMLRAAGIPARPVTGLLQLGGRFYLHAWTEIYLGRWVPVDAMLNQFPADAAHITFLTGTADPGPDLGRILGRLEMTVVSTVGAPK